MIKKKITWKQLYTIILSIMLILISSTTYSQTLSYPQFIDTGNPTQDSLNYQAAIQTYDAAKQALIPRALRSNITSVGSNTSVNNATAALAANCIIPRDASWIAVPRNDDGFLGPINLGFTFNLYGTPYTQCYINTNGNLTFTGGYSPYSPSGFPFSVPMVAAFWADEDTRVDCNGVGQIFYKLEATRLVVTWEEVGYYFQHCDKTVTFQLVIGTTNDPVIGLGQNVLFNYGDMNWTTGDASGGSGGFGGSAATVGVNKGDGTAFVQVGRFDHAGTDYDGGGGVNDGVDYLDNRCYGFNVSSADNIPPSFSGLPSSNTITLSVGQTSNLAIQAIGPEINQTVSTVLNTNGLCGVTANITNGAVSTINLSVTGMSCNVGTHTITLTATDNGTPVKSTVTTLTIIVTAPSVYYSKSTGDLSNVLTWGVNMDGSGLNPPDFTVGKTFNLANRPGIYTLTNNWTVGGILNIPAASQLQINNFTLSIADITGTGSFSGTTASNLIVTQPSSGGTSLNFVATANVLNSLSIISAATTTLTAALNVYGVLTLTSGILNTGNALTLRSTADNTAKVAPVTGAITGTVTIERYIPARRAWRIMSAPVGGTQTINAAWQEGATTSSSNPNPNPGFGTHITEGSATDGFDHNPYTAMLSVKRYISSTNTWTALTNTNATSVNSDAFMLFVRGNRGTPLGYNDVPATITTLRATGPLKVGDQTFPVSASGFTGIPNPFASPINFATISRTNVQNNFYLWDPKVGGINGVGAYVTVSFNGTSYDVSSNAISPESQYIQSGQGFLVSTVTSGVAGSLTIKESDKSNTAAADVFRTAGGSSNPVRNNAPVFADPTQGNGLRLQLQTVNPDNTTAVLDEVFASYKPEYSNKVDQWDAAKATNMAENLGMVRDDKTLAIERKSLPVDGEIINLKLWNTEPKNYIFEINPVNLSTTGLFAYLEDKYLKTTTPISLNKISQVGFSINSSATSARADRFNIVFSKRGTLGELITQSNITAYPNPVTGRSINLQFSGHTEGTYLLSLVNSAGKIVVERKLQYTNGAGILTLPLDKKLTTGVYKLQVKGKDTNETVQILCN